MVHHSECAGVWSGEIIAGLAKKAFSSEKRKIRKKSCFVSFFPLGNSYIDIKREICLKILTALKFNILISCFGFKDLAC